MRAALMMGHHLSISTDEANAGIEHVRQFDRDPGLPDASRSYPASR
jgi:hypothetical protein